MAAARGEGAGLEFDKDDQIAMNFVAAASNLRSRVFQIPVQSCYEAKGIAGNIIPAIATTNAIIAGLQVMEALKILRGGEPIAKACRYTYCLREPTRKGMFLQPTPLEKPARSCFVCNANTLELYVDTEALSLEDLVERVLKQRLGINEPTVSLGATTVYEEGDGADERLEINLPKLLKDLPGGGIKNETSVEVEDFSQDLTVKLNVFHKSFDEEEVPEGFTISGDAKARPDSASPAAVAPKKTNTKERENGNASATGGDGSENDRVEVMDDDVVFIMDDQTKASASEAAAGAPRASAEATAPAETESAEVAGACTATVTSEGTTTGEDNEVIAAGGNDGGPKKRPAPASVGEGEVEGGGPKAVAEVESSSTNGTAPKRAKA